MEPPILAVLDDRWKKHQDLPVFLSPDPTLDVSEKLHHFLENVVAWANINRRFEYTQFCVQALLWIDALSNNVVIPEQVVALNTLAMQLGLMVWIDIYDAFVNTHPILWTINDAVQKTVR